MTTREQTKAGGARWYLERFRSMPLAELPHRLVEALQRRADRRGGFADRNGRAPDALRHRVPPAFPVDHSALAAATSAERSRIAALAASLTAGELVLLGQTWPAGARTDWALDPASGKRWDWQRFCFDIDRRDDRGPGDPKLVWELSRLQHLQILALDARLGANRESRAACLHDLACWIANNPPYRGLGYTCGVDVASRVISLLLVVALLEPESFVPPLRGALWDLFQAHGAWLARYPSLYSSANNHLIAEASGLFALGCLAPQLPAAASWLAAGRLHLEREAGRQIHPDGVGAEQTPSYQASTIEWLLLVRHIARASGQSLAPVIDRRLAAGAEFLAAILDDAGNHPRFGDDDDGAVLRQDLAPERLPLAIAGTAGAVLGNGGCCHPSYRLDLRARLLGAVDPPEPAWRPASATFADGGYSVLRAGDWMAVLDHGPLGFAHTAGHAHADALAVWLHLGATPLLVDAGTYRYNHDRGWRRHLRSSAAHNTLTIDGIDQSQQTGPFNWGRRRAGGQLLHADLAESPRVTARHDGYSHLGVSHERSLTLDRNSVQIEDLVAGSGPHHLRFTLQFAPGSRLEPCSGLSWQICCSDGTEAILVFTGPALAARVVEQTTEPGPGAVSTAYNRLVPAPALLWEGTVQLPVGAVTRITRSARGAG